MKIIDTNALTIIKLNYKQDFIFLHDNCPINVSKKCNEFFEKAKIKVLQWPSYSPDLNIMENIWGNLPKDVYSKGPIKNLKTLEFYLKVTISNFNETQSMQVINL